MYNLLPQAYFIEVVQWALALIAVVLVAWMVYDTWVDLQTYREAIRRDRELPLDWFWQALGNYRQERWRLFETLLLLGVGSWSLITSTPDGKVYYIWDYNHSVVFWDYHQNINVWRVIALLITACKVGSSLTARYYRHRANLAAKERLS